MKPTFVDAMAAAAMKANGLDCKWFFEKYKSWIVAERGQETWDAAMSEGTNGR